MQKSIMVDGIKYIPETEAAKNVLATSLKGLKYVIVRTYSAGVFAGYLKSREGQEVVLINARRLWMWVGAASLSQLAMEGVSKPNECKFPCEADSVELLQAIEIIPCTQKAKESIASVPVWKA
jgi:hypothetical protein